MIDKKAVNFRIKPYAQEALLQIAIEIFIVAIGTIVLALVKCPSIVYVLLCAFYFSLALFFEYRVIIQAIIDKWKEDYITEIVSIKKYTEEFSFSGDRLGHSHICHFYPKEMQVCRYKIKVLDIYGNKQKLRAVMSLAQLHRFADLTKTQVEYLQVTYLKKSKILICVDFPESVYQDNSQSKKNKQEVIRKAFIKKTIHVINMSV